MSERVDLVRALAVLAEEPAEQHAALASALDLPAPPSAIEHTDLFVLQVYPFASVYVGTEGMLGGEARDRVAGFWRAVGQTPPPEPDHIAALLGLYAGLLEHAERETDPARRVMAEQAASALLWEHLLSWVPVFLVKVREAGAAFHQRWADLLLAVLANEAAGLDRDLPLPIHLASGPLLSEEPSLDEFVGGVLAPIRSGIVITRGDLARGAVNAGVGSRIGERRFVLKAMFEQDARATLRWLSSEAARWREIHSAGAHAGVISRFWMERAAAASALWEQMAGTQDKKEVVLGVAGS